MAKTNRNRVEIENLKHDETRVNIPTAETSDFMTDEQKAGEEVAYQRYRRDPALDPQLVWQGKDEEDADDLRVFVRPIYVNEKIQPKAVVENVRALAAEGMPFQMSLFDDFNGINFEDAVDFYQHEQHWTNRMILGDALAVMGSLAEKEGLRGKVQMIYIDPPYGIKFNSNWQPSTVKRDVKDGKDVSYEPEQIQAFRDTWERGIHSYLGYLRDRLRLARELLTESGSVFVQIGDENVHLVRNLLDEVFGTENFVSQITYAKTTGATQVLLSGTTDYILWYCRDKDKVKYRQLFYRKSVGGEGAAKYDQVELSDGSRRSMTGEEKENPNLLVDDARVYRLDNLTSQSQGREKGEGAASWFPVLIQHGEFRPTLQTRWKTNQEGMLRLIYSHRIQITGSTLAYVRFIDDFPAYSISNLWTDIGGIQSRADPKVYVVQTATPAIERCMLMTTDPGDLVLDPTCGSGTTAYVAEQWGRRWITIDTSRVALTLARTRLMSARFPSYKLKTDGVRDGFIYKTVPHITLKSIANNEQIDVIHAKYQPYLDELRERVNALVHKPFEEWEIPRPDPDAEPSQLQDLLAEWWQVRRERQLEMDAAIQAAADQETLYDQPETKPKTVRVTGPFTVESLQPHRALESGGRSAEADNAGRFALDMLEQLRESGVTNTRRGEKIMFTTLDLYPGKYITAAGTYEQAGQTGRAAVFIGPQYGTVSREMIEQAAREAVKEKLNSFAMLIVCGFAFDPLVGEETKNYGRLIVQTARINPDLLLMGKDLKKDGKVNLFTVFGEPDIQIEQLNDGRLVVHLLGVDVYDPNNGSIRSSSTDEIACWFIDTDYNDTSFFVRHAYFTGADRPYDRLKNALKSEINPEAWEALYRTESIPLDLPQSGKIAVKVINHYGDEVMKVCEIS